LIRPTGNALTIPYGINENGTAWIDPTGTDITAAGNGGAGQGLPAKAVNIFGGNVMIAGASGSTRPPRSTLPGGGSLCVPLGYRDGRDE